MTKNEQHAVYALYAAACEFASARDRAAEALASIAERATRGAASLREVTDVDATIGACGSAYLGVNSLGEIQGAGPEADRLVAVAHEKAGTYLALKRFAAAVGLRDVAASAPTTDDLRNL